MATICLTKEIVMLRKVDALIHYNYEIDGST